MSDALAAIEAARQAVKDRCQQIDEQIAELKLERNQIATALGANRPAPKTAGERVRYGCRTDAMMAYVRSLAPGTRFTSLELRDASGLTKTSMSKYGEKITGTGLARFVSNGKRGRSNVFERTDKE